MKDEVLSASLEAFSDKLADLHCKNEQVAYHLRAKLNWYVDDGKPVTDMHYDLKDALDNCHEVWKLIDEMILILNSLPHGK